MKIQNNSGERVSTIMGKKPIILVAPHGYQDDDKNTAYICEHVAKTINCYAVINRGWERSDSVDPSFDKADCNNVNHCHQDVVKEEFLDPILRFSARLLRKNPFAYIFFIHGMSNFHRLSSGIYDLDIVVGFGDNEKNDFSCSLWRKDLFCFSLHQNGFKIAEGTKKSKMSGSHPLNMNQLFVRKYPNPLMQSMQLEIVETRRRTSEATKKTADLLSNAFLKTLETNNFYVTNQFDAY